MSGGGQHLGARTLKSAMEMVRRMLRERGSSCQGRGSQQCQAEARHEPAGEGTKGRATKPPAIPAIPAIPATPADTRPTDSTPFPPRTSASPSLRRDQHSFGHRYLLGSLSVFYLSNRLALPCMCLPVATVEPLTNCKTSESGLYHVQSAAHFCGPAFYLVWCMVTFHTLAMLRCRQM